MSDEEEMMNNDQPVTTTTTTTTKTTSESPISKAVAAHLESLMQGDEADDQDLALAPVLDLGPEADEEDFLDNDYTMDGDGQEDEGEYGDIYADAEVEVEVEPTLEPIDIPIIFSTSKSGGAWDDRDLVTAFDAAKEEFHLHNPGPGSWLDKTTAALAKGKPLVGAQYGETNLIKTRWYTSYDPTEDPIVPRSAHASSSNAAQGSNRKETTGKGGKQAKKRKRGGEQGTTTGVGGAGEVPRYQPRQDQNSQGKRVRIDHAPMVNPYLSATTPAYPNPYLDASSSTQGYRPVVSDYRPTSPVYTPLSPNFQETRLADGQYVGMDSDAFGRSIPTAAAVTGGSGSGMLGPIIPDDARYEAMDRGVGGRRLPNYAGLASPSASPPANRQGGPRDQPQYQARASLAGQQTRPSNPYHPSSQPQSQAPVPQPQAQARPRGPLQDPTYEPTGSGVYPSMGTSGFSSGVEMNREVAVSRAVNAQWWAGYWFAMSEVLPPAEGQ